MTQKTGTSDTPFRWTGQYQDSETGLYYLRARFYDPATGQFLTRDPITPLTQAAYSYAGGDPLNITDPTGLGCRPWSPADCISSAVDAVAGAATWTLEKVRANRELVEAIAVVGVCTATTGGACGVVALGVLLFEGGFLAHELEAGEISTGEAVAGAATVVVGLGTARALPWLLSKADMGYRAAWIAIAREFSPRHRFLTEASGAGLAGLMSLAAGVAPATGGGECEIPSLRPIGG